MTPPLADVALLTEQRYLARRAEPGDWYLSNILREDELLQAALSERGLTSVRVDWADPTVDWSAFRLAVLRTTWDYFNRYREFKAWLSRAAARTRLCNPEATIRWNADKHYLAELERRGIPIVPSRYLECGSQVSLEAELVASGWEQGVIKPCVSGAARHTYRVDAGNVAGLEPVIQQLLGQESLILQPFIEEVVQSGEDTLMLFGGRYTHAVRKRAKQGDFRVQDDFGGTVSAYEPTDEQIELAERTLASCQPLPTYGRVDMVQGATGSWMIMELELIEPELWLRMHPPAAHAFAEAICSALQ